MVHTTHPIGDHRIWKVRLRLWCEWAYLLWLPLPTRILSGRIKHRDAASTGSEGIESYGDSQKKGTSPSARKKAILWHDLSTLIKGERDSIASSIFLQTGGLQGDVPSSSKDMNKGPPLWWKKKWTSTAELEVNLESFKEARHSYQ